MNAFFHIGFPKAGSTSLQRQIFPSLDENITYLGLHAVEDDENLSALLDRFYNGTLKTDGLHFDPDKRLKDRKKIEKLFPDTALLFSHEAGISTIYSYPDVRTKAERLAQVFEGDLKIIIILREQISILSSVYRDHPFEPKDIVNGRPLSFEEWYKQMDALRYFSFTDLLYYDQVVKIYDELFGADNVLVLPLELMNTDPKLYAKKMADFFDIKPAAIAKKLGKKPKNTGNTARLNQLRRIRRKLPASIHFSKILPQPVYDGLLNLAQKGDKEEISIPENLKAEIAMRYSASNKALEPRIGISLKSLGYAVEPRAQENHA